MQTIQIVHPNDPRGTGNPLTITARKLGFVSNMKREEELLKLKKPYEIERTSASGEIVKGVLWGDPVATIESNLFWLRSLEGIATGWLNPPTEDEDGSPVALTFGHEGLMYLFDPKFNVPAGYTFPKQDGSPYTTVGPISFPFYVVMEAGKPERWVNPTSGGSTTT